MLNGELLKIMEALASADYEILSFRESRNDLNMLEIDLHISPLHKRSKEAVVKLAQALAPAGYEILSYNVLLKPLWDADLKITPLPKAENNADS
jgi:hypothetical protein